jgi:hypothetical protein
MVMLDSARRKTRVSVLFRWLLGLGIAATLAPNVAHGLGTGPLTGNAEARDPPREQAVEVFGGQLAPERTGGVSTRTRP